MSEKFLDWIALLMVAAIGILVFIVLIPIMAPKFYNVGIVLYIWFLYLIKNPICDIIIMLCD